MELRELKQYLETIDEEYDNFDVSLILLSQDKELDCKVYEDRKWLRIIPVEVDDGK
jgi:hypothetical protein